MSRILVVAPLPTSIAVAILASHGHEVLCVETGTRGISSAEDEEEWDLVLLQLEQTDMTGVELATCLRWRHPGLRLVVFSRSIDSALKVSALDAGADDYWVTPMGDAEMIARVRAVLRRGQN